MALVTTHPSESSNTRGYQMKAGDTVKFVSPLDSSETSERFIVLELRGDRALVRLVCSMPIPPTFVYLLADLVLA